MNVGEQFYGSGGGNPHNDAITSYTSIDMLDTTAGFIAPLVASLFGGTYIPRTRPGQSVYGSLQAAFVNTPLDRLISTSVHAQMSRMFADDLSGLFVRFGLDQSVVGSTPEELRKFLLDGAGQLGSSFLGTLALPMLDSLISGAYGGSVESMNSAVFASRGMLADRSHLFNPLDAGAQIANASSAASFANMLTSIISPSVDGKASMVADKSFTRGLSRSEIGAIAMSMAGSGAFNYDGKTYQEQILDALAGTDVSPAQLDATKGDFGEDITGATSSIQGAAASKVSAIRDRIKNTLGEGIKAVEALKDIVGDTNEAIAKLDEMTGGRWRSSADDAISARRQARELAAAAIQYDLDPRDALKRVSLTRGLLQSASGFTPDVLAMGIDTGGLYGMSAQTVLLESAEEKIRARGLLPNSREANAIRAQSAQAQAQAINSYAGRGAQLLAYARQTGAVSDAEFESIKSDLVSGDAGRLESGVDNLLVSYFGNADYGRERMNDSMFMNNMRRSMSSEAGAEATRILIEGSDREMLTRNVKANIDSALAYSEFVKDKSGMLLNRSGDQVDRMVMGMVSALEGGDQQSQFYARFLHEKYSDLVRSGTSADIAMDIAVDAVTRSPDGVRYAGAMKMAAAEAELGYNIDLLSGSATRGAAYIAKSVADSLYYSRDIGADFHSDLMDKIRSGDADGALRALDQNVVNLRGASVGRYQDLRDQASKEAASMLAGLESRRDAVAASKAAGEYGNDAVLGVINDAAAVLRDVRGGGDVESAVRRLTDSRIGLVFGDDRINSILYDVQSGDYKALDGHLSWLGAMSRNFVESSSRVLQDANMSLGMQGFFGYSAGRSLQEVIGGNASLAEAMDEAAGKAASTRTNVAEALYSALIGRSDFLSVLGIHKDGSVLGKKLEDLGFKGVQTEISAAVSKLTGDLDRASSGLSPEQKAIVDNLSKRISDFKDIDVDGISDAIDKADIPAETKEKLKGTLKLKSTVVERTNDAAKVVATALKDSSVQSEIATVMRDKEMYNIEARTTPYLDEFLSDAIELGGVKGSRYADAIESIIQSEAVSAADVEKRLGSEFSARAVGEYTALERKAIVDVFRDKAGSGDEVAAKAYTELKMLAKKTESVVTGTLQLVGAGLYASADLDGSMVTTSGA